MIGDFYEMTPDLQRCKRATAWRYQCQDANNQAVAVLNGVPRAGAPDGICRVDSIVHEFDAERIEALTGPKLYFRAGRGDGDFIGDGLQPGPIGVRADKLQCAAKAAEIGS